jgi:delta1-piperideine-2-carboxylate reductase
MVVVDAKGGFAAPAFAAGRALLVDKTKRQGIAMLALHRSRHFSAVQIDTVL